MSVVFNGTTQFLFSDQTFSVLTTPCTISVWFKADNVTATATLAAIDFHAVASYRVLGALDAGGNVAGDPVRAYAYNGTAFGIATTTTGYPATTWTHACGTFASSTSRTAFINGGSKGTNTDSMTGTVNELTIGARRSASAVGFFAGKIAQVAIWNTVLSDAQIAALASGTNPTAISPGSLIAYYPLLGDATPSVGTETLQNVGSPTYDTDDSPGINPELSWKRILVEDMPTANPVFDGLTLNGEAGIGATTPDARLEIETSATEGKQAVTIDQNDADQPFIDFQGTSAADQANNISTVNGDGAVDGPKNKSASAGWTFAGMLRQEINGTVGWIPYYTAQP